MFTNSDSIEYPTRDDIVDIDVLNNNFWLLQEKKADKTELEENLENVAKETSPNNIENNVLDISSKLEDISLKLVKEDNLKFWHYPNKDSRFVRTGLHNNGYVFLDIQGSGHLMLANFFLEERVPSRTISVNCSFTVEIDGEVQYKLTFKNYSTTGSRTFISGIINKDIYENMCVQNGVLKKAYFSSPIITITNMRYPTVISYDACSEKIKKEFEVNICDNYTSRNFDDISFEGLMVFGEQQIMEKPIEFKNSLRIIYNTQNVENDDVYTSCSYIYSLKDK